MMTRRTLFASIAATALPFLAKAMPNRTPFIHADVLGVHASYGVDLHDVSGGDFRVYIDGQQIPEAQEFDTRARTIQYVIFRDTPKPIHRRGGFQEPKERSYITAFMPDGSIPMGTYTGPFTVAWCTEDGKTGRFEVK